MAGKPVQQGSMKAFNNRVVHQKSKELLAWRQLVGLHARQAGCTVLTGPVGLSLVFTLEKPKTVRRIMPTVPPDLDKQVRSILDALTGVAYVDDAQVCEISAAKAYGSPGVWIELWEIKEKIEN